MKVMYRVGLTALLMAASGWMAHNGSRPVVAAEQSVRYGAVLLSVSGNGIANTRRFHAPGTWRIVYSFSHCEIPGFAVYVKGGPDDIASDERNSGSGVQYEYRGGNVYLTMNTACSWRVTVYSGRWVVRGPGLRIGGNGITNTIAFRVPSEWKIHYSFWNCSIPDFAIYVQGGDGDILSRQGKRGSGVQYEHAGGIISLSINTACFWQVNITR